MPKAHWRLHLVGIEAASFIAWIDSSKLGLSVQRKA